LAEVSIGSGCAASGWAASDHIGGRNSIAVTPSAASTMTSVTTTRGGSGRRSAPGIFGGVIMSMPVAAGSPHAAFVVAKARFVQYGVRR